MLFFISFIAVFLCLLAYLAYQNATCHRLLNEAISDIQKKIKLNQEKIVTESSEKKIRIIKKWLQKNYYKTKSNESLAQMVHMSSDHLGRIFLKATGKKISEYRNEIRIEKAKKLLINQNTRVIDIAHQVGFGEINHFNRLFKKYTDMTPSEFKKKHR